MNARGAIARFSRGTIEIRVLDIAECPAADLAVVTTIIAALKALVAERWAPYSDQKTVPTEPLAALLRATMRDADRTQVAMPGYLGLFGLPEDSPLTAGEMWPRIVNELGVMESLEPASREALQVILESGPLSRRILAAVGDDPARDRLRTVYRRLCDDLAAGKVFRGDV